MKVIFLVLFLTSYSKFSKALTPTEEKIVDERIQYLTNAMEFGDDDAAKELMRIAPDEYRKVKVDFETGKAKIYNFTPSPKSKIMRWPAPSTNENKEKVKQDIIDLKNSYPEKYKDFVLEPLRDDEFPPYSLPDSREDFPISGNYPHTN